MAEPTGSWIEQLHHAREIKGLSLSDIADVTLINVKYLEQIDQGNTTMLPQTYVRAFIREYAAVVGLDPDAIMREYDRASAPATQSASAPAPAPARPPAADASAPPVAWLRWMFSAVAVIGAIIILWASFTRETPPPVQEIPFQSVLSENERRLSPAPTPVTAPEPSRTLPTVPADSLVLRASVTDSVWLQIIVDDGLPREYLFRPGARASWKGARSFTVTLGNAGAVEFTLNTTELGFLGKRGSVVRNVQLSRESLTPH
jgi:cytoskeletal protein RodZ